MQLDEKIKEIHAYLDKWGEDLRTELNLHKPGATIGISFDPSIQLSRVPDHQRVTPGTYASRDGQLQVEVTAQDDVSGVVHIEMLQMDDTHPRSEIMSGNLFLVLFKPYASTVLHTRQADSNK